MEGVLSPFGRLGVLGPTARRTAQQTGQQTRPLTALVLGLTACLPIAGCANAPPRHADAETPTPAGALDTGDGRRAPTRADARDRPLRALEAYPGLDTSRLIATREWAAAPTGALAESPGSDRRLTRRSERSTDTDGRPRLRITLDDSEDTEDSVLDLVATDAGVHLVAMETVESTMRFTPALLVWPESITPGQAVVANASVTGERDGRGILGEVLHTLEDISTTEDLGNGYRRVLSEFVFDLGDARVTRTSIRWFRMGDDPGAAPTLVREERSRALKIWIFPARTTDSDWTAVPG